MFERRGGGIILSIPYFPKQTKKHKAYLKVFTEQYLSRQGCYSTSPQGSSTRHQHFDRTLRHFDKTLRHLRQILPFCKHEPIFLSLNNLMKINRLFTRPIPSHIIQQLLEAFALNGLEDTRNFTVLDLERHHTVEKITALRSTLVMYYLPCKAELYLKSITTRSCLTILRQVVKLHQYVLCSKQIYIMRKK